VQSRWLVIGPSSPAIQISRIMQGSFRLVSTRRASNHHQRPSLEGLRFGPIRQPGDLVQLDTKKVRPARGVVLKHFSARDMVSRWDVLEVHDAPLPWPRRTFWTRWSIACLSPSPLYRWMAAASSLPNSRPLASNATCRSSCSRRVRRNSMGRSNALIARTTRSFIK